MLKGPVAADIGQYALHSGKIMYHKTAKVLMHNRYNYVIVSYFKHLSMVKVSNLL